MRVCSDHTGEGTIWPVDAACAPRARPARWCAPSPATARYYERWAKTWEFQALLKARPVAGDLDARPASTSTLVAPLVWQAAERDGFVADVQAMRRRVRRAHPGRARPTASSSSAPAGCATSSSPSSCSSSCTAAPTTALRGADHAERARRADRRRLRRPRGRRGAARRPTASCAPSSTASSCTSCAAPTSCPTTRRRCAGSAARMGFVKDPVAELDEAWQHAPPRGAPAAREALLPAAARRRSPGSPADEARLTPGGGRAAAGGARLRRPDGGAAAPRGAHQRGDAGPPRSSARCCRRCSAGSPTRPTRTPGCSASGRSQRGAGLDAWYLQTAARRGRRSPSGWRRVLATSRYATDLLEREPEGVRMLGDDEAARRWRARRCRRR